MSPAPKPPNLMSCLRIIPGTPHLVRFLAARMSQEQHATLAPDVDAALQGFENDVQNAARTWCGVDDGGPVILLAATVYSDPVTAKLWFITSAPEAVTPHLRACVRLWRRAVAEMVTEFGTVCVDVPAYVAPARRMARYGFAVSAPFDQGEGTVICRCAMQSGRAQGVFHPYLPLAPSA